MADNKLTMRLEFLPNTSPLQKAVAGFESMLAFRKLIALVSDDAGATGMVDWNITEMGFDGEDADAQPIYDALINAYKAGLKESTDGTR